MPIKLNGSSSGFTQIDAASVAGNNTLTLPTASGTLMTTGGTNTFTANQVIEVTDNTNAALRITQLGTGNALLVEDSANPDSTPFVVDASGKVGIGTASPSFALDVSSNTNYMTRFGGTLNNYLGIQIANASNGSSACSYLQFGNDALGYASYIGHNSSTSTQPGGANALTLYQTLNAPMVFFTNNAERMRIDSSGNITASGATNRYAGANQDAAWLTASGTVVTLLCGDSGSAANGIFQYNRSSGGILVRAGGSGGVSLGFGGTSWAAVSDERAKDIIEPIADAASKVSTLRAVIGKYKDDESAKRRSFLIAQDVQNVLPEAIDTTDPDNLGLAYTDVIPLLVAAIKEQQATIASLEARLAALENA